VVAGDFFQSVLRREVSALSEPAIELVTKFAINGSKRVKSTKNTVDIDTDLI
jgi:hypothetical protein